MQHEVNEAINNLIESKLNGIHTAMPAKIVGFDSSTGMASVLPYGNYETDEGESIEYPQITGVPVIFPQCQTVNAHIFFPVKKGDDCLLVISEEELDLWLFGENDDGTVRFDLTSAICIPGLCQKPGNALKESCSTNSVIIQSGNTKLAVGDSCVTLSGNLTVNGSISYTGTLNGSARE